MKTKPLGHTGMEVSVISYGGIVSNMKAPSGQMLSDTPQAESDKYVQYALDHGVNYFDVAPTYGEAQLRLGNSLRGYREGVYLACKTTERDYDGARREFEESLAMLHTDYFDTYQMDALNTIEELNRAFSENGVMRLILEQKKAGRVRHVGITSHSEATVLEALRRYDFDTVLFPLNWMMNRGFRMGNALIEEAHRRGVGLLCMKSMVERSYFGPDDPARARHPKSWCKLLETDTQADLLLAAMKYSWSLGIDTLIPPGDFEHFEFAVEHADKLSEPLTDAETALLRDHLEQVRDWPFFDPATASVGKG